MGSTRACLWARIQVGRVDSNIPAHLVDIHSLSSETMFTVVGFDAKPISGPPPPGPYKMQRTTTITHVFDDEL